MAIYLRPHLPFNIAIKSRLDNKVKYLELRVEERSLKMVGSTENFGKGGVVLGQFDKTPVLPQLLDGFLRFQGHYTLREVYFRDDRQASNPKHYFFITSGKDGTSPELDLIGEQALAAYQAKKTETQVASINEKFNELLLENVKTNKRHRKG